MQSIQIFTKMNLMAAKCIYFMPTKFVPKVFKYLSGLKNSVQDTTDFSNDVLQWSRRCPSHIYKCVCSVIKNNVFW